MHRKRSGKNRSTASVKAPIKYRRIEVNPESSSDEEANPYLDLLSMVAPKEQKTSSDSESEEEPQATDALGVNVSKEIVDETIQSSDNDSNEGGDEIDVNDCLSKDTLMDEDDVQDMGISDESDDDNHSVSISSANYKSDYYKRHLDIDISKYTNTLEKEKLQNKCNMEWNVMDKLSHSCRVVISGNFVPQTPISKHTSEDELHSKHHVRKHLVDNWLGVNKESKFGGNFTPLQREFFTLINSYNDVNYANMNVVGSNLEIMKAYCLHIANHLLRCRAKVLTHTARLKQMTPEQQELSDYRDQGITRPRILILVPFRNTALQIVDLLLKLFQRGSTFQAGYKKRFFKEFGSEEQNSIADKPVDFQAIFEGNTDEHFRIGIALLRNSVRLYSPFYSSDIIISSPLGLRTVMGAPDEKHYEYDFLSSIEMVVIDQADVFLMQNWEHVLHVFKHLNIPPKDSHGVDFSRVRNISLDSLDKFYRQTIVISSVILPLISSLFNKFCFNHQGLLSAEQSREKGSICAIAKQIPQVFHKLLPPTLVDSAELRFRFFVDKIYKQYKESKMTHSLVYIPQYFDFVRLRNFMRKEWKSGSGPMFAHINDYSTPTEAGKAKRRFFTGKCSMMLYTERYYFYNRNKIRGMKNLIFYELPTFAHYYSELCNMIRDDGDAGISTSVIALYSKYDIHKLIATVGETRGKEMLSSDKTVHMLVTNS